jgi:hypothetical protein
MSLKYDTTVYREYKNILDHLEPEIRGMHRLDACIPKTVLK